MKTIPLLSIILFSLPMISGGAMNFLIGNYLLKYATDVLLITPGIMGTIFLISRIWDAFNDPIVGHLSDKTETRLGGRLPWILGSALPVAISFVLLWIAPPHWKPDYQAIWLAFWLLLFFTAITALYIPHYSLGAELSANPFERNRIFGVRAIFENIGNFIGVAMMLFLTNLPADRLRISHTIDSIIPLIGLLSLFFIGSIFLIRKRASQSSHQASDKPFIQSLISAFANPRARLVFIVGFLSQLGAAFIMSMTLYFAEYVLLQREQGAIYIGLFMLFATIAIPIWIHISKRIDKRSLWIGAKLILGLGFSLTFFIGPQQHIWMQILSSTLGAFAGAVLIVHPSMLADSLNPKEGSLEGIYFSLFTFINKSAMALAPALTGWLLAFASFVPNELQQPQTVFCIRIGYAFLPALFFVSGALILITYQRGSRKNNQLDVY